ncbi:MAG: hypothetical protein KDA84_04705 [Planctomycetaceae bacterium]|nr:hypothetical protein [Planctomycetaceae bacterium]
MSRQLSILSVVAFVIALATCSQADAWPGYHVGVTHVGMGGVQHYGRTGYAGPRGYGSVSHYGATGGGLYGGYHVGGTAAGGVRYGGGVGYGGVRYGGYRSGAVGFRGGFARRW